ncbi:TetR/AcrR family transcriptional regulator [Natronomonas sp. EA1]|uniref:TetR/AcrR family transcriptional regulator n=1 Tax=Natronomonas sp. EA1 TaxID=3421655 RepID=UPI003EB6DDC0
MSDATDDIMRATFCALCKHGYADLTMQRIADESSVSKAALHYHYDTKDELLEAFLSQLLDRFRNRLETADAEGPTERLDAFLDEVFTPTVEAEEEFATAILELKAGAPYQSAFRERLLDHDAFMREWVGAIVADGLDSGAFDTDRPPKELARSVVTMINGAHARRVALDESRASLHAQVRCDALAILGAREVPA